MKNNHLLVVGLLLSFLSFNLSNAQTDVIEQTNESIKYHANVNNSLTKKELSQIKEAYGDMAETLILNHPQRLKDLKHLLRNRIEIYTQDDIAKQKQTKLLSEVLLFTKYNKNLKRDTEFRLETFNPLKYELDFFAKGTYVYRIDNTNYFIQITSQYRQ
ncbi:hypothetical protein [Psychroserpens sp. S379A]|uniref:hypothetical protein n=1 Tax=Psychroserpens sp. S379A TaxID=3415137 RepID=UPI003C7D0CDD